MGAPQPEPDDLSRIEPQGTHSTGCSHASMLRCFLLLCLVVPAWGCARPTATPQPNIVLLVADDLGYSDLALYADTGLVAPHLERMASSGMRFTDFYVAAAFCSPVPGRAAYG